MSFKTATLIALICTALQTLIIGGTFVSPSMRYEIQSNILFRFIGLAGLASMTLFFFTLYSKQQKG